MQGNANGVAFSVNVGDVDLAGIDGQVAFKPNDMLSFYGSILFLASSSKRSTKTRKPSTNSRKTMQALAARKKPNTKKTASLKK